jgi:hypothetical protein
MDVVVFAVWLMLMPCLLTAIGLSLDIGAPWTWLGAVAAALFAVSFWTLRKYSKGVAQSLIGPVIFTPAFWFWIIFCAIKFDPFF